MNIYLKGTLSVCLSAIFACSLIGNCVAHSDDVTCRKHGENYRCYDKHNKHVSDVKKTDHGYQIRDKNNRKIGEVKEQVPGRPHGKYNVYDKNNRKTGVIKPDQSRHNTFKYKSNVNNTSKIIKTDPKNGKVKVHDNK